MIDPDPSRAPVIRPAVNADMPSVRGLFAEYQAALGVDLSFQGFADEMASLPGAYVEPAGRLLLAEGEHGILGVGCLRPAVGGDCEMKRLYVRPSGRGLGLGRRLAACLIEAAKLQGYRRMLLDTLPFMTEAHALYQSLGFRPIHAYRHNPVPGTRYMALELETRRPQRPVPVVCAAHTLEDSTMATLAEVTAFVRSEFPQTKCTIRAVGNMGATVAHEVGVAELRPGGTVSGPVLMAVADVALYVAILGEIGIVPLTVTTNLSINFLRKPPPDRSVVGVCKLIKLGRSLAVGEVSLYSDGSDAVVAHAVGTYSIPPNRPGGGASALR